MEPRLTTKLYLEVPVTLSGVVVMNLIFSKNSDGNVKCNKVLTDMSLGARSDKRQQHRQMFTYRGLHGVLEV
jgi:hypothetical protein